MIRTTISIAGVLIAGAIFFLYTQPAYDSAQGVRNQIARYDQALDNAAKLQAKKQELLSTLNTFPQQDLDNLHNMLPDHVDNIRLILDMDDIAAKRNMQLSNVDISGNDSNGRSQTVIGSLGASNQKYESLSIGFSTTGTYENFKLFLGDLQRSLRLVDFTSLSISPANSFATAAPGVIPEQTFNFGIKLKTYWLK